jgi:hypothetical protein
MRFSISTTVALSIAGFVTLEKRLRLCRTVCRDCLSLARGGISFCLRISTNLIETKLVFTAADEDGWTIVRSSAMKNGCDRRICGRLRSLSNTSKIAGGKP